MCLQKLVVFDIKFVNLGFLSELCWNPGWKAKIHRYQILQWMVQMGSLATLDPDQGCNKKDGAKANAWNTRPGFKQI